MSEKMDGMRGYWNGHDLLSRHGRYLITPNWFTSGLPSVCLDGELWMGRGTFEILQTLISSRDPNHGNWSEVGYYLFDLPSSTCPYEERLNELEQLKGLPSH